MNNLPASAGPKVQTTPKFEKGDTLECASTGLPFKVLKVVKEGYVCEGRAGIMPKTAARKPLTDEERKALAEKEDEG